MVFRCAGGLHGPHPSQINVAVLIGTCASGYLLDAVVAPLKRLQAFIAAIVATLAERGPKQMGVVMGALKAKYGGDFDAKQASAWIKSALS